MSEPELVMADSGLSTSTMGSDDRVGDPTHDITRYMIGGIIKRPLSSNKI